MDIFSKSSDEVWTPTKNIDYEMQSETALIYEGY
jgi:hypothetical protein